MPSSPAVRRRPVVISRRGGDPTAAGVCARTDAYRKTGDCDQNPGRAQHARLGGKVAAHLGAEVDLGHRQRILVA